MIETIFRIAVIFIIVAFVVGILGSTKLSYNIGISNYKVLFSSFLLCIAYIVPIDRLLPIFAIVVGYTVLKISISIVKNFWDIVPMRG